jgi:transposase
MAKARNAYSNELKKEVLDKIKAGTSAVDVASAYGIDVGRIYNWISSRADFNPSATQVGKLARENRALKEIVAELTIEVSRFKKNKYGK